jgi:hypothetical protein
MTNSGQSLEICYLLVIITTIGFLVWGFIELLKQPGGYEISAKRSGNADFKTEGLTEEIGGHTSKGNPVTLAVISRQLRGFALIMLAQIILVVGMGLCTGLFMPPSMSSGSSRMSSCSSKR